MLSAIAARRKMGWRPSLAILWALYFFAIFSAGRFEEWQRTIIWGGGGLITLLTVLGQRFSIRRIPREVFLIAALLGWSLLGGFESSDWDGYLYYFRLTFEMLATIALLGLVIRKSGTVNVVWWAVLAVAVFNTVAITMTAPLQVGGEYGHVERAKGLIDNANGLAFLCFMGILGALALAGEKTSLLVKAIAASGAFVAFWGMLATGARGAYVSFIVALFLWPLMCIGSRTKRKWVPIAATVLSCVLLYGVVGWVQANTNLGERTTRGFTREDASSEVRLQLVLTGLRIAMQHPLTGVGLGQFGIASGSGTYAHNEWVELLATTGVPGFLLFMGVYWSAWRRLSRALRTAIDPILRYRINFARMTLIILVVAGATFRPNFVSVDTMFLLAIVVGVSWWAKDQTSGAAVWKRPSVRRSILHSRPAIPIGALRAPAPRTAPAGSHP